MFSVEEANVVLPFLSQMIARLQTKKLEILKREIEIDALELVSGTREGKQNPEIKSCLESYERAVNEFYHIIDEIHHRGCLLKDVDSGLVDFYSVHNGRVVYLCWQLGEEGISSWHEIGRGYMHRQPIWAG